MTLGRWRLLREIFEIALTMPGTERARFVEDRCNGDEALYVDAAAMLEAHDFEDSILDTDLEIMAPHAFDPEADLYIGRTVWPYRFTKRIAVGGMSRVYQAERLDYGGKVAIKVLYDRLSAHRRQLFETEKRRLAELNHPSIARIYDAGVLHDGADFLVMEHVAGVELTRYCRDHSPSLSDRLDLFRQVCKAVQYLHQQRIVHRDLKPSNILVQEGGAIKLIDFGISERDGDPSGLTSAAAYMTVAYAAPEQIRNESVSTQADVYSLGMLLHQLVTGSLPFGVQGKSPEELKVAILQTTLAKPSAVAAQLDSDHYNSPSGNMASGIRHADLGAIDWADIDAICANALAGDTSARYGSVESLVRDLDSMRQKRPIERRSGRRYKAMRFLQRNRVTLATVGTFLLIIATLVTSYSIRIKRGLDRERAEAAKTDRVLKFLENVLSGGDPENGPSGGLTLATVLGYAVKNTQTLTTDPSIQAELNGTLASIYNQLEEYSTAESLFQVALRQQSQVHGPDSPETAKAWADLASLRFNEGRNGEAKALIEKALVIDRQTLPEFNSQTAEASILLGEVLNDTGSYKQAVSVLEPVMRYESGTAGRLYDLSSSLSALSNSYLYLGDLPNAEKYLIRSSEIDRQVNGQDNLDAAENLMSFGTLYTRMNRLPQAEAAERKALAIEQQWFEHKDGAETAAAMIILADTLAAQSKYPEALAQAEDGLAMYQRIRQPPTSGFAHAWSATGLIQDELGNFPEAERDYSRSLAIYRAALPGRNYQIGQTLSNLAIVNGRLKRYSQAEQYSREALQMLAQTLPPDDPDIARAMGHYAESLYADHRPSEAEAQLLEARSILVQHGTTYQSEIDNINGDLARIEREKAAHPPPSTRSRSHDLHEH